MFIFKNLTVFFFTNFIWKF